MVNPAATAVTGRARCYWRRTTRREPGGDQNGTIFAGYFAGYAAGYHAYSKHNYDYSAGITGGSAARYT